MLQRETGCVRRNKGEVCYRKRPGVSEGIKEKYVTERDRVRQKE